MRQLYKERSGHRSYVTHMTYGVLVSKQKEGCGPADTDREEHNVILYKVRVGHQRQAKQHWLPDVHSFPVDEGNEADRSEKQTAYKVGSTENRHGLLES